MAMDSIRINGLTILVFQNSYVHKLIGVAISLY